MNYSIHSNKFGAFFDRRGRLIPVSEQLVNGRSWGVNVRTCSNYYCLSIHRIRIAEKGRRTTWFFAEILRVPIRFDSVTEFRLFVFIFIRSGMELLNSVSWEKICWDFEEIYFQLHILTRPYLRSFVRSFLCVRFVVDSVCHTRLPPPSSQRETLKLCF